MSDSIGPVSEAASGRPTVNVKLQQAYDVRVSLEFRPAGEIPVSRAVGCRPRQGGERVDKQPLDLPEEIRGRLKEIDGRLIGWLAKDEGNRHAFVSDPLGALRESGIELDRADLKALSRAREEAGRSVAVTPGLQLREVGAVAKTKGRIRPVGGAKEARSWSPPQLPDDDCGCEDREGEA